MNEVIGSVRSATYTVAHNKIMRLAASRITESLPCTFRMAQYPDGRKIVQGGHVWTEGSKRGIEWRDLPLVKVNEDGQEVAQ